MSIASFAFLARFRIILAAGQNFNAGMLKLKHGILLGVDNRFMLTIMTESGAMSTEKIIFFALDFAGAGRGAQPPARS